MAKKKPIKVKRVIPSVTLGKLYELQRVIKELLAVDFAKCPVCGNVYHFDTEFAGEVTIHKCCDCKTRFIYVD